MSRYLLRSDELNVIKGRLNAKEHSTPQTDIIDEMLGFLLLAYADGKQGVENDFRKETTQNVDAVRESVYRVIDGKTWEERLNEHLQNGDVAAVERLAITESHRIYNEAAYDTAKKLGATKKVWNGVMDDKTRDSHFYLDGTVKGIDEPFQTIYGNEGQYPGQFGVPEEDVNCRCSLTFF